MALPLDVTRILEMLTSGIRTALGNNLVGVYPRGSLATGEFMATSDLDLLTVSERAIDDAEFAALAVLHDRVAALPSPYASRLELAYIDRTAVARFTGGQRHPTLYWGSHSPGASTATTGSSSGGPFASTACHCSAPTRRR